MWLCIVIAEALNASLVRQMRGVIFGSQLPGNRAEYDTPGMQANMGIQVLIGAVCRSERLEAIDPVSYPMLMHALSSSSRSALSRT